MYPAVAALPIAVALILLVGLRWKAARAMPVCAAVAVAAALLVWRVPPIRTGAAVIEAGWITASILYIVLGALLLLAVMKRAGALAAVEGYFAAVSPDRRIQAIIVAWLLGSFIEGAAGFGTPAAITAPLLVGLGFRPIAAVVVALIGDSTAVTYGAVGTPITVGLTEGLAGAGGPTLVGEVVHRIALFDLLLGTLMPVVLVLTLTVGFGGRGGWRAGCARLRSRRWSGWSI
jgi:lactate permease